MSSPISICYIELILEPVKKRICGSATFRFPPSEPLLLKENPVVSGILFCDVLIFFFCLEQLMMFQSGFVDLGGMMFPDDILLKSVYDWCNVLRPWIKSAGLKGSKRGGLLQPGATGRQGRMGALRWVSPGWRREGGAATCSWSSLSSSTATSAGQHGGYADEPAISSYHSDPIYGW